MDFFFNQNVADGANLFVIILALLVGLGAGLSYIDTQKVKKEDEGRN